jgi:hypothetical protein
MRGEQTDTRSSIFGALSIAAPISAILAFFGFIHLYPSDPAGFGGVFIGLYTAFGLCILGLLSSIIGFIRREPRTWLYWLGFFITLIPSLVAFPYIPRLLAR